MKPLKEIFESVLDTEPAELEEKAIALDKQAITMIQVKAHRAGNKITWDQAKDEWMAINYPKVQKERKPREMKGPKKPKITPAKFNKMMRDTRMDLESDGMDIEQVASDVAASMLYDKDIDYYVRYQIHKNTGKDMDMIPKWQVQEYLADNIYG